MMWSELKDKISAQMSSDPQRATLSLRAIASVEEGLRHLAQVGHSFELAPRGTLGELRGELEAARLQQLPRPLSIEDAVALVQPGVVNGGGSEVFDAK